MPNVLRFFLTRGPVGAEQVWNCEAWQVIDVPKISQDWTQQRLVDTLRQPQTVEQLVEVPTIVSFSTLQRIAEQNVDIPVVGGSGAGGSLSGFSPRTVLFCRSLTIQILGRVVLEVFKIFVMERVQQRFRSRSPSYPIQVEVVKIFSQSMGLRYTSVWPAWLQT